MRFEWNCITDFIIGYLAKVILVAIGLFSAIAGITYLITMYVFGDYLPAQQWIRILTAIFVASFLIAQGIAYHRIARRLVPGERIEEHLRRIADLREEGVNNLQNVDRTTTRTDKDFHNF